MNKDLKIVLSGGAGLVGQNLIVYLFEQGYSNITLIDKHSENIKILKTLQSNIAVIEADLADSGDWERVFVDTDVVIMLQAQIGGNSKEQYQRNTIQSTKNILKAIHDQSVTPYIIHISSSVLESLADDFYTQSKKEQEELITHSPYKHTILRPTLMFGWFDRKHLGWLARFMKKIPVFPVPGDGQYMRQPLYVKDFCNIIISCIEQKPQNRIYNISGQKHITYIDIIRLIKKTIASKAVVLHIPITIFSFLLSVWAIFDKNPPFTVSQLKALRIKEEFEVIDWQTIFSVKETPFSSAIEETFSHPKYSQINLKF